MTTSEQSVAPALDEGVGELAKRLVQQTQALAETELQRLRLEAEQRAAHAQKVAVALAILVPLLTLLLGTLGAALVLWVNRFMALLPACLIVAGAYLLLTVIVLWRIQRFGSRIFASTPTPVDESQAPMLHAPQVQALPSGAELKSS